jgi:hypothetical protein
MDERRVLEIQSDFNKELHLFVAKWLDNLRILEVSAHTPAIMAIPMSHFIVGVCMGLEIKSEQRHAILAPLLTNMAQEGDRLWRDRERVKEIANSQLEHLRQQLQPLLGALKRP